MDDETRKTPEEIIRAFWRLTWDDRRVLSLCHEGLSDDEILKRMKYLKMTPDKLAKSFARLYETFGVSDRAGLVAYLGKQNKEQENDPRQKALTRLTVGDMTVLGLCQQGLSDEEILEYKWLPKLTPEKLAESLTRIYPVYGVSDRAGLDAHLEGQKREDEEREKAWFDAEYSPRILRYAAKGMADEDIARRMSEKHPLDSFDLAVITDTLRRICQRLSISREDIPKWARKQGLQ